MNPWPTEPRILTQPCAGAVRVLLLHHVQDNTYAISEDGEVSLSGRADLIQLLNQLSGRDDQ
jgi:hypothetical protein